MSGKSTTKAQKGKRKSDNKSVSGENNASSVSSFHTWLIFFRYNAFGRFLAGLLLLILLIFFNIALSQNKLETFALITGIEFIIGMIAGWTVFLLKRNVDQEVDEETEN